MEQMKTKIDLKPISEQEISEKFILMDDLWLIKADEEVYGPFETTTLRAYAQKYEYLFEEAFAQNLTGNAWKLFFQNTKFQRRAPKLIPAQSLVTSENFLVVQNALKEGPYNLKELKERVESGLISLRSEISIDDGATWIKLYEHHEFDRRQRAKVGELPFSPTEDSFKKSEDFALKIIDDNKVKKDEEDALVGLAFVSQGKDRGQQVKDLGVKYAPKRRNQSFAQSKEDLIQKKTRKKIFFMKAAGFSFAIALFYVLSNSTPDINLYTQENRVVTQVKEIDNSERNLLKKQEATSPQRKPASIKRETPKQKKQVTRRMMENSRWQKNRKMEAPRKIREIASEYSENKYNEEDPYGTVDPRDSYNNQDEHRTMQTTHYNEGLYPENESEMQGEMLLNQEDYQEIQDFE